MNNCDVELWCNNSLGRKTPYFTVCKNISKCPLYHKQVETLKSCKMKEAWIKSDEGWTKNEEGWMMNDDDFKLLKGFALGRTKKRTDICDCRVAFATENLSI